MKTIKYIILSLFTIVIISCSGVGSQPATGEGFAAIEKEIKSKFGDNPYFTKLTIMYDKRIGNSISLIATKDPETLKMGEWLFTQGSWKQTSEITLEVPEGAKAADFMFQLDDKISLTKLGESVEHAKKHLTSEKKVENPVLSMAFVKFPRNGDASKAEYSISLEPENGGTNFSYYYALDGKFKEMDY